MACEFCYRVSEHHPRCPNYNPPKTNHYCSICDNGICDEEEYIENEYGEYAHFNCFRSMRDLLEWLGYRINIMEDEQ